MPIYKLFVSIFHFWYQYNTASIWDDVKNGEPPLKIYLWQKTVENCTGCYISLPSHEEGHWKWDLRIHWKRVWNKLKYWNKSLARGELILQIRLQRWSFFCNDGMVMFFFQGTIAINGFSMVLPALDHHHWMFFYRSTIDIDGFPMVFSNSGAMVSDGFEVLKTL